MVIPCLCLFTALRTLAAEPPVNKKRTRTLFRKESGSSTNCMVDGTGLEQGGSAKQSKQSAQCNDDDRSQRLKQGGVVGAAF